MSPCPNVICLSDPPCPTQILKQRRFHVVKTCHPERRREASEVDSSGLSSAEFLDEEEGEGSPKFSKFHYAPHQACRNLMLVASVPIPVLLHFIEPNSPCRCHSGKLVELCKLCSCNLQPFSASSRQRGCSILCTWKKASH